jgi:hypothetical protein
MRARHCLAALLWLCVAATCALAQQTPSATAPAAEVGANTEFLKAADEVLAEMSKLLSLPVREPLKRSVRSKDEIRAYLVRNMHEDQDSAKLHADVRTLELLGLLPKDYPLEQKLIDLLTQQIAGVYDSKGREFFIAASTPPAEQRVVMAHELTHALEDQSFHIQQWTKAAKGNDDAQFARDAVLEGSAMVAMMDYLLRDAAPSFRDLGSFDPALLLGGTDDSPELNGVPLVLKDQLLFPYLAGAAFSAKVLEAHGGWTGLRYIFEKPPASTQQIMHPDLYLRGVQPEAVELPRMNGVVPRGWKKLDENIMGEFGMNQVIKQFLGKARADELAALWAGDRYAVYEQSPQSRAMLVLRMRVAGEAEASRFFSGYSELLEKKYADRTSVEKQTNSLFIETPDGGAFVRCMGRDCLLGEGATRTQFDAMARSIGWPALRPPAAVAPGLSAAIASGIIPLAPQTDSLLQRPAPR